MTKSLAEHLIRVEAIIAATPVSLTRVEAAEYSKILDRVHRTHSDLRRAETHGDEKKIAAAKRAITRARDARDAFCAPRIGHFPAPLRIVFKKTLPWSGAGISGIHRFEVEMVLAYKDLSGPQYHLARVLLDIGGPPTNPRQAPECMGVAWAYLTDQIRSGRITVVDDGDLAPWSAAA